MLTLVPPNALTKLWQTHKPLTLSGLIIGFLTLLFIVGIFTDPRVINGSPAWLKPTKFGISFTLYNLTLAWMLGLVRGRRGLVGFLEWLVVAAFVLEMTAIVTQVVRSTTSHFNFATPFDAALWSVMGTSIVVLWLANLVIAGLLVFQHFDNPTFAWGLRLGLIVALIGMALGFLMVVPTAQQMAGWQGGEPVTLVGAHTVGLPDGGPGLPLVGWSTTAGDLRVSHFVGMHALQVIPFIGWLISRRRQLALQRQVSLVWVVSGFYLGFVGLLTLQALRAQPLLQPDLLTLGLFAGLVVSAGLAVWFTLRGQEAEDVQESAFV